jgi:hypothetical protein
MINVIFINVIFKVLVLTMDGYLNYKVNIVSDRFLEVEVLTPNDISSYDALIYIGNNWHG